MKKRNKFLGGLLAFFLAAMPFTAMNVRAVDDTTPPSVPSNLTATLNSANQVFLDWDASTDNTGVTGYKVMRGNDTITSNATSTSYLDTSVVASTTYAYSVLAFDANGNNSSSTAQVMITTGAATSTDTTAPTAPVLTGTAASATQINLSWTGSTDNVAVTGYNIYKDNAWFASTASSTYNVSGLNASTSYAFYIKAYDAKGNLSNNSNTLNISTLSGQGGNDTTIPTAPVLSGTAVSASQINLNWTASTDNVAVNGYNVYKDNNYLGRTTSTSWSVTGLSANTEYSFRVRAYDSSGNLSQNSNILKIKTMSGTGGGDNNGHDTIAPSVPANLRITATSSNSVTLAWNASTDAVGVAGYNIYHDGNWLAMSPTNSFTETGINPNEHHSYYVRAFDERGNVSGQSNIVTTDGEDPTFDNDTVAPSVPTNLMVTDKSYNSIKLSWTASTDNVETIGYNVYRNGEWLASIDHATTFVDNGLSASTAYSYYVRAYDVRGNTSGESNTVTATTGSSYSDDDDDDEDKGDNVYQKKNKGNNGNHYGQIKNGNNGKHLGWEKDNDNRTSRNWNR